MEIRQLTAVVAVADAGSVTAAARLLHVVQPAVTRQVRTLEEELGVALFTRTRQGMTLTAEGELLVERARRALAELERARLEISPDQAPVAGLVQVGLLDSVTAVLAQPLAAAVAARYPGIELHVMTAYSGHLRQWLERGDLDLSLLYDLAADPAVAVIPLLREQLWAAAPPDAGLSPDSPVSWHQLLRHPLVLPVPGHGLRTLIDTALVGASTAGTGPAPRVAVQVNSMDLQKRLVLGGRGWTVLPASGVAGDVAAGWLSGAPLADPEVVRSVVLGLRHPRSSAGRTPAPVLAVAAELRQLVRDLVLSGAWPAGLDTAQHDGPGAARPAGTAGGPMSGPRRAMGRPR